MLSDKFYFTAIPYYEHKKLQEIKLRSTVSCSKFGVLFKMFGFFPVHILFDFVFC